MNDQTLGEEKHWTTVCCEKHDLDSNFYDQYVSNTVADAYFLNIQSIQMCQTSFEFLQIPWKFSCRIVYK